MSFAGGAKRTSTGFMSGSPNNKATTPAEPVVIIVCATSIIKLTIPFGTPRAKAIRSYMHTNIVTADGAKIFIYTDASGWTNVALDSTLSEPKLTEEPAATVRAAKAAFTACTGVPTRALRTA